MSSETYDGGMMQSKENEELSPELEEQCLHFLSKNMWGVLCELLKTNESDKEAIVKFMDNLLDGEYEANVLRRHPNLHFKDTRNIIKKWLWKILKMHKFPKGICPNLLSSHRMGFISHTFHQYQRQQTSHYNWRELVLNTAGDCKRTQRRVVNMLLGLGMIQEAARFANDFQFDDDEFTSELQQERQNCREKSEDLSEESEVFWGPADESHKGDPETIANPFHEFPYPRPTIKILSNKQQFLNCVSHLSQPGSVVGVDTEWQTLFDSATDNDCIALIQLATSDIVYILDVITLMPILSSDDWLHFFDQVFCNENVIKLGYGLSQDFKIIKHTFPYINTELFVQIVDLQNAMDKKMCSQNRKDAKERRRRHKGLSGLTEDYLFKPLDKTYQVSCWSKRPLLKVQVLYAALDAFVLLQLYEIALQKNIDLSNTDQCSPKKTPEIQILPEEMDSDERLDLEFSGCLKENASFDFGCSSSIGGESSFQSSLTHQSSQQPPPPPQVPAISPHSLRVIVDTMLQGLGWSLRSVGVDTLILKNGQSHKDAIALAIRENRVVLTSGKIYQMFSARLGEDKCYCVANNKAKKQLQDVLQHFNVRVQKQDILSRCQLCNSKTFILVESDKMRTLKEVKAQQQKSPTPTDKAWSSNPNGRSSPEFIADPDVSACLPILEDVGGACRMSGPILEDDHFIDINTAVFQNSGVPIQLEYIPDCLFEENKLFYCCVSCGKVYWDGCHHERVINQLNGLIPLHNDNEQDPSIYDILQANTCSTDPPVTNQ